MKTCPDCGGLGETYADIGGSYVSCDACQTKRSEEFQRFLRMDMPRIQRERQQHEADARLGRIVRAFRCSACCREACAIDPILNTIATCPSCAANLHSALAAALRKEQR